MTNDEVGGPLYNEWFTYCNNLEEIERLSGKLFSSYEAFSSDSLHRTSSGQWLKDFEADERGEIGTDVDRSVLSEDGLYNLMEDLDDLMHTFEELQDKFAADPDLELKLQD